MEKQALTYLQNMLDKATQKGVFTLAETAHIVAALEKLDELIISTQVNHGKEEN